MNQVATTSGAGRAVAQAQASQSTQQTAQMIAELDRLLLAPIREVEATWSAKRTGWADALKFERYAIPTAEVFAERDEAYRERVKGELAEIDARMMSRNEAEAYIRVMQIAWSTKPSRNRNGLLIARLIDSFPNARAHNPTTYRENLVHLCEIDGYSPAVVALACDAIMRDPAHEFLPAPAAFLAACKKQLEGLQRNHRFGWISLKGRQRLDAHRAVLAEVETGVPALMPAEPDQALAPPPEPTRSAFV